MNKNFLAIAIEYKDIYYYSIIMAIISCKHLTTGMERNFDIMRANTGNVPYDYGSVMHYRTTAFSANGRPTITTRQPARIGQRWGLSSLDWRHVQNYCSHVGKSGK